MQNLKFKYLRAKNFLCFGPDEIEIDLEKQGNIILIRGDNQDVKDEEERIASNGVGKSSLPEIIVYTLFGRTIKSPKKINHDNVINNKSAKKLETEVRWDDYRVIRGRKPNFLRLWQSAEDIWDDNTEITLGGMPETEREIERILGLNYETFVNTIVFTDNNAGAFLECDTPTKRKIVENLLSLDKYVEYFESAKKSRNEYKDSVDNITRDYQRFLDDLAACRKRADTVAQQEKEWKAKKKNDLELLNQRIEAKKQELEASDLGLALSRYNEAQDKIATLNASIPDLNSKLTRVKEILREANDKLTSIKEQKHTFSLEIATDQQLMETCQADVEKGEKAIASLESKKGSKCPVCHGEVSEDNYGEFVTHTRECVEKNRTKLLWLEVELVRKNKETTELNAHAKQLQAAISVADAKQTELINKLAQVKNEIQELSKVQKPEALSHEKILEDQVEELKKQTVKLKEEIDGVSPFAEILKNALQESAAKDTECQAKKAELEVAEKDLPYYEFWVKAFGDKGIRKFVIDGIIPALNSRIAYWLQFLIDGRIGLCFNNQLEETIERNPPDGDPFVYYAMSGGERRRLNLAVSQSFAYVMMLNSGVSPSLVFLDEVTTNIDPMGVQGVFNMICELAKEKQVFVTTHDHDLLDMLSGYKQINLVKRNGFTKLV